MEEAAEAVVPSWSPPLVGTVVSFGGLALAASERVLLLRMSMQKSIPATKRQKRQMQVIRKRRLTLLESSSVGSNVEMVVVIVVKLL